MSPRWKLKQLAEGIQEYDPSQINFKDGNGAYMGKWERSYCLLTPGRDETRLSGMYIRSTDIVQLLTVGTPPSGNAFFIRQSLVTCFFFVCTTGAEFYLCTPYKQLVTGDRVDKVLCIYHSKV